MTVRALLADRLRALAERLDPDAWATGLTVRTASDATTYLVRCSRCGLPRRTVHHASVCALGRCDDPDARRTPRVGVTAEFKNPPRTVC